MPVLLAFCGWLVVTFYKLQQKDAVLAPRPPLTAVSEIGLLYFALLVVTFELISGHFLFKDPLILSVVFTGIFFICFAIVSRRYAKLYARKWKFRSGNLSEDKNRFRNAPAFFLIAITFVTALIAVPNNWDSMTYHLPRVMHWMQNGSLAHYYSGIDRQISQPPGAELLIMGMGFFSKDGVPWLLQPNLVQWAAYVICILESGRLVGLLGGGHSAKWAARLLMASLPMAILQATSTQNDLLMAALVLSTATTGLNAYHYGLRFRSSFFFFLSVGLAFITKGTAMIYLPPLLFYFLLIVSRKFLVDRSVFGSNGNLKLVAYFFLTLVFIAALNSGHWQRNNKSFDSPLGPSYELSAERFDPPAVLSSLTKNSFQQLRTPVNLVNTPMEKFVVWFSERLGAKVNDPALHWPYGPAFNLQSHSRREYVHEDYAPAPLHFILGWLALGWVVLRWWRSRNSEDSKEEHWLQAGLALTVILMWLFFSLALKWQIWHPRLHLPFLVMLVFPSALFLESLSKRKRHIIIAIIFIAALPFALSNSSRPLLTKSSILSTSTEKQRFANRIDVFASYKSAISAIAANHPSDSLQLERVGYNKPRNYYWLQNNFALVTSGDSWEYPLWKMETGEERYHRSYGPFFGKHLYHFDKTEVFDSLTEDIYPKFFVYINQQQPAELLFGHDRYKPIFQDATIAIYCLYDSLGDRIEFQEEMVPKLQEIF